MMMTMSIIKITVSDENDHTVKIEKDLVRLLRKSLNKHLCLGFIFLLTYSQ